MDSGSVTSTEVKDEPTDDGVEADGPLDGDDAESKSKRFIYLVIH